VYIAKKEQKKAGEIDNKIKSAKKADSEVKNNKDITKDKVKKEKKKEESNAERRDSNAEREDSNVESNNADNIA
jgi:hypothetical protein